MLTSKPINPLVGLFADVSIELLKEMLPSVGLIVDARPVISLTSFIVALKYFLLTTPQNFVWFVPKYGELEDIVWLPSEYLILPSYITIAGWTMLVPPKSLSTCHAQAEPLYSNLYNLIIYYYYTNIFCVRQESLVFLLQNSFPQW